MESQSTAFSNQRRCAYCGSKSPVVWVHGHGQCAACGINIAECCQGERCELKAMNNEG